MKAALLVEPQPHRSWFTWISAEPDVLLGGLAAGGGGCGGGGCCCSCDWKEEISEYREFPHIYAMMQPAEEELL